MIILASVNDALQLILDTNTAVDIHATWVDTKTSDGTITPGRLNTAMAAPATVNVAPAPGAGLQRNVKTLHVRNKGASACNVTIQHTDGTIVAQLFKAALQAGKALQMSDGMGFTVLV